MTSVGGRAWHALIRTHHITSRKKVAKLRQAASAEAVYALIRYGGAPGIMYCEGDQIGVENWIASVQIHMKRLRYKDFQLAIKPAEMEPNLNSLFQAKDMIGLHQAESVKDFANHMKARGVLQWWRKGMGYAEDQDRL
ncbi:hypothetical protein Slin15195_G048370 [Septoria linicola]|uniref:Uncharacterized protein n=1 Tax=Septoria linicola TaxID=215465 RepID=A0A9Q9AQY9_9PEZI|nr:hypothetical protein Slin14017_G051940 [Septoria linicola]USW51518.1 hypothetical protein Slin15195_G048370 [Septoria linicola]